MRRPVHGPGGDGAWRVPVWEEVPHLFPMTYRAALAWAEEVTCVSEAHASVEAYAAASAAFEAKDRVGCVAFT